VSMVRAIVHLASSLSMTAHAEGIETEAQWRVLQRHGCALGQGYHFSPPVPASEIEQRFGREAHPALQRGGVA
jgi:EAL domain-containing protein (putative c-di-GMP-specific phosphodiesterase class I)